jgi:hypothetical protein
MPEYLSPGVYVEEIDTGPKPIEGVSTSTVGMVGLTERGPVDVPILVTGPGDYARWFGGLLDRATFLDNGLLPHAVDGFFRNGGRRLYLTRVAPDEAVRAENRLFHAPAGAALGATALLRPVREGTGNAAPSLVVLGTVDLDPNVVVRIGDGSRAEYRQATVTPGTNRHLPLDRPLALAHPGGVDVIGYASAALAGFGGDYTLATDAAPGDTSLSVNAADDLSMMPAGALPAMVELASPGLREDARLTSAPAPAAPFTVELDRPLALAHDAASAVVRLRGIPKPLPAARLLESEAAAGDQLLFTTPGAGAPGEIVEIDIAGQHEIRARGELSRLELRPPAYAAYPARTTIEHVSVADDAAVPARELTANAPAAAVSLEINDRTGLTAGDLVRIGASADPGREYAHLATLPGAGTQTPDPGVIVLELPLRAAHAATSEVARQDPPALAGNPTARLVLDANAGAPAVIATDATGYAAASPEQLIRATTPAGARGYHQITGAEPTAPGEVTLDRPLIWSHAVGDPLVERQALLRVQALDVGSWGNRLLISTEGENPGLLTQARVTGVSPPLACALSTLTGIEAGTVLELVDPATGNPIDRPLKVRRVDRGAANPIVLDAAWGLTATHLGAIAGAIEPLPVRSREFRLTVLLRRQDDPAVPSRGEQILDSETFRYLSMDPRHSRYVVRIIGDLAGPSRRSDRRPEGESAFVRVAICERPQSARRSIWGRRR